VEHLDTLAGGASSAAAAVGAIGTRGPGEKQIEIDRRLVQRRVSALKAQLEEIDRRKVREVNSRQEQFCVCLVGYTNAGKSTLMNLLTGGGRLRGRQTLRHAGDQDPQVAARRRAVDPVSDTVGFVRDLPHRLVASFKATLEEAIGADLLIHVADASHDRVEHEIRAVEGVLDEIGCDRGRVMLAMNKIDKISDPAVFTLLGKQYPDAVFVSAATGQGPTSSSRRSPRGPAEATFA